MNSFSFTKNWDGYGLFIAPPIPNSLAGCGLADAINTAPLYKSFTNTLNNNKSVRRPVPLLVSPTGPLTVISTVISIIINSIERMALWAITHIGDKLLEGFSPLVADGNTPPSVSRIFFIQSVVAPTKHMVIRAIKSFYVNTRKQLLNITNIIFSFTHNQIIP